jgi:hypothetical protein
MNSKSMLLVLAALMCVSLVSASTWDYCSGTSAATSGIVVSGVTLNPDPPVLGQNDIVTLTGTVNETVSGGTVSLTITYYGIPVFSGTYNTCDSNTCPQGPGAITAQITVSGDSLPPVAPPGNYVGTAIVTDQNGFQLVCVAVDFTL